MSFIGKAQEIYEQEGLLYFWSGIGALLFRELPFAIAKVRCSVTLCGGGGGGWGVYMWQVAWRAVFGQVAFAIVGSEVHVFL